MPGRRNIVLTRASSNKEQEATLFSSLEEVLNQFGRDDAVFIISGADLYRHSLLWVDMAWVTEIQVKIEEGATFDPLITINGFSLGARNIQQPKLARSLINFNVLIE